VIKLAAGRISLCTADATRVAFDWSRNQAVQAGLPELHLHFVEGGE